MIPTSALQLQIATLLATDTTTLAEATFVNLHLAKAAFTPSPGLTLGALTEADFVGYAAKPVSTATQLVYVDPLTGLITIELVSPAGGWTWHTTGTTNLPQTIYGTFLTDHANALLWGSGLLPSPITLTASGQGIALGAQTFAFSNNSPF